MPSTDHYVGIDASLTATGFAVLDPQGGVVVSSVLKSKAARGAQRLLWLREAVADVLPLGNLVVAVEGYSMGSVNRPYAIGEWGGILRLQLLETRRACVLIVPPSNLKQYATGNGGAKKDTMIARARTLHGIDPKDDNEADALHLARLAFDWDRRTPLQASFAAGMAKVEVYLPKPNPVVVPRIRTKK